MCVGVGDVMEVYVRPWEDKDASALTPLILDYFHETSSRGYDYAATQKNVDNLLKVGMLHASVGDPVLAAFSPVRPVGWTMWIGNVNELEFDFVGSACLGMGTYVIPECRRMGVAKMLHTAASGVAKMRGYQWVDRVAIPSTVGAQMLLSGGWRQAFAVYRKEL